MAKISLLGQKKQEGIEKFLEYIQSLPIGTKKTFNDILEDNPNIHQLRIDEFLQNINTAIHPLTFNKTKEYYVLKKPRTKKENVSTKNDFEILLEISEITISNTISICNDMLSQLKAMKLQLTEIRSKIKTTKKSK